MLVVTKVTGSQFVEVAVMAHVLSTRSGMHKSLRLHCLRRISNTAIIRASVNFLHFGAEEGNF